jgi:N-acetylglutamate synthase-like GNAT family acetyltransferase
VPDDPLEIVRAGDSDVPAITDLVRAAYEGYVPRMGRQPKPMTLDYADVVRTRQAWVVRRDGEVVGVLVLEPHDDHVLLENIAVAPSAQRAGIGDRLMRFAEEQARAAGLAEIRLFTNVVMVENLGYYGRRGYRETHRETVDGRHRVFLTKHL